MNGKTKAEGEDGNFETLHTNIIGGEISHFLIFWSSGTFIKPAGTREKQMRIIEKIDNHSKSIELRLSSQKIVFKGVFICSITWGLHIDSGIQILQVL